GLDPARDCLANVDAFARAVPSAMCMAGREFELLAGTTPVEPGADDIARVIGERIMALPAFAAGSGPFGRRPGNWAIEAAKLAPALRRGAASLYCAVVEATCLRLTGATGPVIIEGPFSRNRLFLEALAVLTPQPVLARPESAGTTGGAALLADGPDAVSPELP